jgi:cardiolipin synthase C
MKTVRVQFPPMRVRFCAMTGHRRLARREARVATLRKDEMSRWILLRATLMLVLLGGCASLPPGSRFPKLPSTALADPESTRWGRQFIAASHAHDEKSAYRIFSVGVDGFLMRMEMINAAERTLDLQYYIFRGDETGGLLTDALKRAADRGVRIRLLVDDGDTVAGDEQLFGIANHANIEIRVFNPFRYRGHNRFWRDSEFVVSHARLDHRMHNKLLIADNAVALAGGRNVGDQYFQIDPKSQFADDDVFAGGPVAQKLSEKFDEFWNSELAIPSAALYPTSKAPRPERVRAEKIKKAGFDYQSKLARGEPLAGLLAGQLPLAWADAQVVGDSPQRRGDALYEPVAKAVSAVQSELLIVSPYVIPSKDQWDLLKDRRTHHVRVRILTNSLESAPELSAHSGYMHVRKRLLQEGVELNEVRSHLDSVKGSGQSSTVSSYGNYALHAKLYVMDRQCLFIGSMNWDQRSRHLNTEIGLIIESPELAQETARRFEAMTQPAASYSVVMSDKSPISTQITWRTSEEGVAVVYEKEPARSAWQRMRVRALALIPLDSEL